jgi:hypothetical protein
MKAYESTDNVIKPPRHFRFIVCNPSSASFLKEKFILTGGRVAGIGNDWKIYNLPTTENEQNLPDGYVDQQIAENSEFYVKRYIYGSWESAEGLVYPEFNRTKHLTEPERIKEYIRRKPDKCKIICVLDPGYQHKFAVLWGLVDSKKKIHIFDEIWETEKTPEQIADLIHQKNAENGIKPDIYLIDPAANTVQGTSGKSTTLILQQKGIYCINAKKPVWEGILFVKQALLNGSISIQASCVSIIKEFGLYIWDKNKPEEVVKKNDDLMDCLRMMVLAEYKGQIIKEKENVLHPEIGKQRYYSKLLTEDQKEETIPHFYGI